MTKHNEALELLAAALEQNGQPASAIAVRDKDRPAAMFMTPTAVALRAIEAALSRPSYADAGWLPIESAPKDGTVIWAVFYPDIFPRLRPYRPDLEGWNGVQVPLRHPGIFDGEDGKPFDMGWNVAAPVGNGGFPDRFLPPRPPIKETGGERG